MVSMLNFSAVRRGRRSIKLVFAFFFSAKHAAL